MFENYCILIQISLKFVPGGPINNKAALIQTVAWRQTSAKQSSEQMTVQSSDAYAYASHGLNNYCKLMHWGRVMHICISIFIIIGSDNDLSPGRRQAIILTNAGILLIWPLRINSVKYQSKLIYFHSRKCIWICRLQNVSHFVSATMCSGLDLKGCPTVQDR